MFLIDAKFAAGEEGTLDILKCAGFVLESWHIKGSYQELLNQVGNFTVCKENYLNVNLLINTI